MTRQEVLFNTQERIKAFNVNIKKKDVETVLTAYLDVVGGILSIGEDVPLGALGKLKVVERAERHCTNPQTREEVIVPAHKTVKFSPSKTLKEAMKK